jgi:hypothetical protein
MHINVHNNRGTQMSKEEVIGTYRHPSKSLREQAIRAIDRFKLSRPVWEAQRKVMVRNADVFWWRTRYAMMSRAAKAFLAIQHIPGNIGPNIHKWKSLNDKASDIIRVIGDLVIERRKSFTVSEVEAAMPRRYCSKKTLYKVINDGVDLKLLEKDDNGDYNLTELYVFEFGQRMLYRNLDRDIINWARQVVMFDDMVRISHETVREEQKGELFDSKMRTISERLEIGDYDEELDYVREPVDRFDRKG